MSISSQAEHSHGIPRLGPSSGRAQLWQGVALFLAGVVATGVLMMVRGDFLGTRAAELVERRLSGEISATETRFNTRMDREMVVIRQDIREIKESLVRLEERGQ